MTHCEWIWHSPPAELNLSSYEVHVWRADLDRPIDQVERLAQMLSDDEQCRAERFYFERDRQRFIVGRGALRTILSRYLKVEPKALVFSYGVRGKPEMAAPFDGSQIRFNLSHSQGLALYAIALNHEVGIDLEQIRPIAEVDRLTNRFFATQENAVLQTLSLDQRQEIFFRYWTCKEAYIKASGAGLSQPTQEVEVSLEPGNERLLRIAGSEAEGDRWLLKPFIPEASYTAALVVEGHDWQLSCWQWANRSSE